jgi:hypothetical protein
MALFQLIPELHEGIAADPRSMNLARQEQRCDLLIGSPRHQFDRLAELRLEIGPQEAEQFEIVGQEHRGEAESEGLALRSSPPREGQ